MRKLNSIGEISLVAASMVLLLGLRTPQIQGQEKTLETVPSSVEDGELESVDEFKDIEEWGGIEEYEDSGVEPSRGHRGFRLALIALAFTVLAGFLVRFKPLRSTRTVFLLSSLAVLGFWNGGCPCPISSFQNLALWALNVDVEIHSLWWFLGLIPITYVFGRVWCGWVCHLGALQEFVHKSNRFSSLRGEGAQKTMRMLKYGLFVVLIVQLIWTRNNQFIHVDPFKVAFNLRSFYVTGWLLLGVLMLSSLYIYRPFCRSACPVGLVLGWVSRLPYASKLGINDDCRTCKLCTQACAPQAIRVVAREVEVRQEECLVCGSCMDACRKDCVSFYRKEVSDVRETIASGLDHGSLPVSYDKANGRARVRERSGGAPETGEGRVEPRVGTRADRTGRVSG